MHVHCAMYIVQLLKLVTFYVSSWKHMVVKVLKCTGFFYLSLYSCSLCTYFLKGSNFYESQTCKYAYVDTWCISGSKVVVLIWNSTHMHPQFNFFCSKLALMTWNVKYRNSYILYTMMSILWRNMHLFIPEADVRKKVNVYKLCAVVRHDKRNYSYSSHTYISIQYIIMYIFCM